jgi:hypothetical protein
MVLDLQSARIAHGDLQHGNVVITARGIVLVDYDGMFVPGLSGRPSGEDGHRNFQHPRRTGADFGPELDNFSAWAVYLSLLALAEDPTLWSRVAAAGDERLLLAQSDYENPARSDAFDEMQFVSRDLAPMVQTLAGFAAGRPSDVPRLPDHAFTRATAGFASAGASASPGVQIPEASSHSGRPTWLIDHLPPAEPPPVPHLGADRWVLLTALLTALAGGLSGFASPILAILVIVTVFASAAGFVVVRLKTLPASRLRRAKSEELRRADRAVREAEGALAGVRRALSRIQESLGRETKTLRDEIKKLDSTMVESVHNAERVRDKEVVAEKLALANIDSAQASEIQREFSAFQRAELSKMLARYSIQSAEIHGVGESVKAALFRAGVRTAADIEGGRMSNYRYQSQEYLLRIRGRGEVHVHSIGPAKGSAIVSWSYHLEQSLRSRLPTQLPADQLRTIVEKYRNQRVSHEAAIRLAEDSARRNILGLREQRRRDESSIAGKIAEAQATANRAAEPIKEKLRLAQPTYTEAEWQKSRVARDLKGIPRYSLLKYLLVVARPPQDAP